MKCHQHRCFGVPINNRLSFLPGVAESHFQGDKTQDCIPCNIVLSVPRYLHKYYNQTNNHLLEVFPKDVKILRGKTRCCIEGCRRNTEAVLEVFYQDFDGKGDFSILMGKGVDQEEAGRINGPVHLAGDCAIADNYQKMKKRIGKKRITCSPGCNNLAATVDGLTKWMKISPLKLVPMNPLKSLGILVQAKISGSKANIPPVLKF